MNSAVPLTVMSVRAAMCGVSRACGSVAYEPVWAIGTAEHHATPQQAATAHAMLRASFGKAFGEPAAKALTIQYGGSVVPADAVAVLNQPGVDGPLIGGASLKVKDTVHPERSGGLFPQRFRTKPLLLPPRDLRLHETRLTY